jgi:23S rRNA A1618 N6-methylase RlmF
VENPDVVYRDSLSQGHAGEDEKYTLVMANPPFAGSLDYKFLQRGMQPQLFWGTNNRAALQMSKRIYRNSCSHL